MFGEHPTARDSEPPAAMTVRLCHRRVDLDRAALAAAFPSASGRVVVFLHGLVETERSWLHHPDPAAVAQVGNVMGAQGLWRHTPGIRWQAPKTQAKIVHFTDSAHLDDSHRSRCQRRANPVRKGARRGRTHP